MPNLPPNNPANPPKTPEEILREHLNNLAVSLVSSGFGAIDRLAEHGKNELKKAIIRGISPPKKSRSKEK